MLSFLHSSFDKISFDKIIKDRKQKLPYYVSRDEMDKKSSPTPSKLRKRVDSEAKVPLLEGEESVKKIERENINGGVEEKGGVRVKILMTKEEAERLLSKCKDGGRLELKDVAHELVQIPTSRVTVVCDTTRTDGVLESIPEEY